MVRYNTVITSPDQIRTKDQFRALLAKELEYKTDTIIDAGKNRKVYSKRIEDDQGNQIKSFLYLEAVGVSSTGFDLVVQVGVQKDEKVFYTSISGTAALLNIPINPVLELPLYIPKETDVDGNGVTTVEKYHLVKEMILKLEKKRFFQFYLTHQLKQEKEYEKTAQKIINLFHQYLPKFKNSIWDKYQLNQNIYFYADQVKGKIKTPLLYVSLSYNHTFSVTYWFCLLEKGEIVLHPKGKGKSYFYLSKPKYITKKIPVINAEDLLWNLSEMETLAKKVNLLFG